MTGCEQKKKSKGCGNGLLGIGEDCDCGTDPDNLPAGCPAVNGAQQTDTAYCGSCTTACEDGVMSGRFSGNLVVDP